MVRKILLIEDDQFIRDLYERQFKLAGFEVDSAADGEIGLQKANINTYSMILLDLLLPKINGLDLLKTLKQNSQTKNIPVVILSNLANDTHLETGMRLGALAYIIKSQSTPRQVIEQIQSLL